MDWAVVEVVIGLSFMFFLISIVASAANEAIAGIFKLRARSLEQGIKNLLTGKTDPSKDELGIVLQLYDHALVNGYQKSTREDESADTSKTDFMNGPSYLASRSFRNALLDVTELLETTAAPPDDPLRLEEFRVAVQEKIDTLPDHLKDSLTTIWRSANKDVGEFRKGVERWFDRGMERVSGWYKRRAQLILFIVGLVVAIAINASALTAADRLWKESGYRKGLVAQVEHQQASTTGTKALTDLKELEFPIGWEQENRPTNAGGWVLALLGWLITGLAVTLGAPFWFDALGRLSNLRAAGAKPASVLPPAES